MHNLEEESAAPTHGDEGGDRLHISGMLLQAHDTDVTLPRLGTFRSKFMFFLALQNAIISCQWTDSNMQLYLPTYTNITSLLYYMHGTRPPGRPRTD